MQRVAVVVEDIDGKAEATSLNLAAPDRAGRIAEHEAANDVGAAGDGGQMNIALDLAIDEIEAFRGERRTGRGDGADRIQLMRLARLQAGLMDRVDVFGRGAE